MIAIRIVVGVVGALAALASLGSAIRTVVVPRGEQSLMTRATVITVRRVFDFFADRRKDWEAHEAVKARFGPVALMMFPLVWACGVIVGCSGVFWALGVEPYRDAIVLSGSSMTTLGFRTTSDLPTLTLSILEGIVGLGLVALLISFLPTIYTAFSRRENAVAKLDVRATGLDGIPSPGALLARRHAIDALDDMTQTWTEWEDWFVEVEESHTSFPILVFFRSPVPDRSWIISAGLVLDAAALYCSILDRPREPRAQLMIRSGTISLRRICDYFDFEYNSNPQSGDRISIERHEFDSVFDELREQGLPLVADRDQAWRDFAGWRVNYDTPLLSIAGYVDAPPSRWSSDRGIAIRRPKVVRRRNRT